MNDRPWASSASSDSEGVQVPLVKIFMYCDSLADELVVLLCVGVGLLRKWCCGYWVDVGERVEGSLVCVCVGGGVVIVEELVLWVLGRCW